MSDLACPQCNGATRVKDSRSTPQYVRRRRCCKTCGVLFTTEERFVAYDKRADRDMHTPAVSRLLDEAREFAEQIP